MRAALFLSIVLIFAAAVEAELPTTSSSVALAGAPTSQPVSSRAAIITLSGEIDDYNKSVLIENFSKARTAGAHQVILKIDTYGGLVTAGLDISRFLKQQNDLHITAFIDQKAISAGAMIAMACDEIVMQPHAQLGDCAPIVFTTAGSLDSMGAAERAKAESPILSDFQDSAVRNHHDPLLARAMVSVGTEVHWMQDPQGNRKFVDGRMRDELLAQNWTIVGDLSDPIDASDSLLTVSGDKARTIGLVGDLQPSAEALADSRGLSIVGRFTPGFGEALIGILSNAGFRGLVTTIFLASLYAAFSHPGHGMAEVLIVLTLGILIGVPLLTGYAQWWEIMLIFLGLALVALEIFVIPGFGVAGIAGVVLVLGGLVLTFVGNEPAGLPGVLPSLQGSWDSLQRGLLTVVAALTGSLVLWIWLQRYLPKLPYFNRLILAAPGTRPIKFAQDRVLEQPWPPTGLFGRALTELRPGGSAMFSDPESAGPRRSDVISDAGFVPAGATIVVREVSGSRIIVRQADAQADAAPNSAEPA